MWLEFKMMWIDQWNDQLCSVEHLQNFEESCNEGLVEMKFERWRGVLNRQMNKIIKGLQDRGIRMAMRGKMNWQKIRVEVLAK